MATVRSDAEKIQRRVIDELCWDTRVDATASASRWKTVS